MNRELRRKLERDERRGKIHKERVVPLPAAFDEFTVFDMPQSILDQISNGSIDAIQGVPVFRDNTGVWTELMPALEGWIYQSRLINRCLQTKAGITQYLFWPTAIINKPEKAQLVINRPKMMAARREIANKKPIDSQPIKVDSMKKTAKKSDAKYPATLIVKTAAQNPNIKFDELVELLIDGNKADYQKARDMVYYCVKSKLLSKDSSKQLTIGTNDAWLIKHGLFVNGQNSITGATPGTTDALDQHLKDETAAEDLAPQATNTLHMAEIDATFCINKLFALLPINCGFGLEKLADGNMHIKVSLYEKTYLPKADEVESCINAIRTLSNFEAVH